MVCWLIKDNKLQGFPQPKKEQKLLSIEEKEGSKRSKKMSSFINFIQRTMAKKLPFGDEGKRMRTFKKFHLQL